VIGWLNESFVLAMQLAGAQAGYSYAATIDPATEVDSAILQIFAQLFVGLLLFATGVDRELLRALGASLHVYPPGSFRFHAGMLDAVGHWTSSSVTLALRLALPVIATLALVDLALALVGRVQSQLQLLSVAFPAKTLLGLALTALLWSAFPPAYASAAGRAAALLSELLLRRPPG
jgi:flagellar biosynthetic protein FliR